MDRNMAKTFDKASFKTCVYTVVSWERDRERVSLTVHPQIQQHQTSSKRDRLGL